jgi:hypothetical protein
MIGKLTAWKSTIGARPNLPSRPLISQDFGTANLSFEIQAPALLTFLIGVSLK